MNKILIYINNIPIYVVPQITVLQACDNIGLSIPRFCYHDLLSIAGNCRICLVEIEHSPKPQASCSLPVVNKIKIYTDTPIVKKAREAVLEFLLLNHPLDCPICDQGGECDLQNQTIKYSSLRSRFYENRRVVEDKGFGPIVKTVITRCIHCTKCIRFISELAGVDDLGTTLRGSAIEIGTYTVKSLVSELTGNIIDLCPVGALTTKSQAFKTRPWEIKTVLGIDTIDSLGSHISIELKKFKPFRVVPRTFLKINSEWITDKARFAYEGFTKNRIAFAYYYHQNNFKSFSSFNYIGKTLTNYLKAQFNINIFFGCNLDFETLLLGKNLCKKQGWDYADENCYKLFPTFPLFFQSTVFFREIKNLNFCIILGINLKKEASLVNIHLKKLTTVNSVNISCFGSFNDLTYKNNILGLNYNNLILIIQGKHSLNSSEKFNKSLLIYGDILAKRNDANSAIILASTYQNLITRDNITTSLRLPIGSNSVGKSFLGLAFPNSFETNFSNENIQTNYFVGIQTNKLFKKINSLSVVENSHYINIKNCKFLVPIQTVYEKSGTFINCEGRLQKTDSFLRFSQEPLGFSKNFLNSTNSTDNLFFESRSSLHVQLLALTKKQSKVFLTPLKTVFGDIYQNNPVSSASLTLSKISGLNRIVKWNFQ